MRGSVVRLLPLVAERQIQFGGRFTPRLGSLLSEQELTDLLACIRNALERCRPSV
jgi:hypothetical protein